jgi:hypothetical protein
MVDSRISRVRYVCRFEENVQPRPQGPRSCIVAKVHLCDETKPLHVKVKKRTEQMHAHEEI